jgi:biotin transporter BioY
MAKKAGGSPGTGIQILAVCGGVMLMMAAWRFPVPLPHIAPHPTTLLSLIAVLMGIMLGPKNGTLIVAFYVFALILNLPPLIWRLPADDNALRWLFYWGILPI